MSDSPGSKGCKARGVFADMFAAMFGDDHPFGAVAAEMFDDNELKTILSQARAKAQTDRKPVNPPDGSTEAEIAESHPAAVYRTRTIKRRRRTNAEIEQLDRQIIEVLRFDQPQSVRHIFYRMTDPRLPEPVEKTERGYRHVQDRIKKLRRNGRVPYGWITDASRRGYFTPTYSNASDFLKSMKGLYRADLWQDATSYCEVWTESRSIAGVIQDDCEELAVSLYPAGGFTSISLAFQAAEYINAEHFGRDVMIFYLGDYDPAGVLIDVALERELRTHLDSDVSLTFERIAITPEQIAAYNLPTKPRKASELRMPEITATVEAEAMQASVLRTILRDRIEALLPEDALKIARVAEDSERRHIERVAEILGGAS